MQAVRAVVFAVVAVGVSAAACERPPDLDAYCRKATACEDKSRESCLESARRRWKTARELGCAAEMRAVVACEVEHGSCQTSGTWSVYMPGEGCVQLVREEDACRRRGGEAGP